jgi:hypothetical protein
MRIPGHYRGKRGGKSVQRKRRREEHKEISGFNREEEDITKKLHDHDYREDGIDWRRHCLLGAEEGLPVSPINEENMTKEQRMKLEKRCERLNGLLSGNKTTKWKEPWPEEAEAVKKDWPVHAPAVPEINLQRVAELARGTEHEERIEASIRWLQEPPDIPTFPADTCPKSRLKKKQIEDLLKNGVITEIQKEDVFGWSKVAPIPEPKKERFRIITDTLICNIFEKECEKVNFGGPKEVQKCFSGKKHAVCFDFRAYFYQFPYAAGNYCAFQSIGKKFYAFKKAPMGHKNAVGCAHRVSCLLSDVGVSKDVIIDNVCLCADSKQVLAEARETFLERCAYVNATLSEKGDITSVFVHQGREFNLEEQKFRLKEEWTKVFVQRCSYLLSTKTVSQEQLESVLGMWAYACAACPNSRPICSIVKQLARSTRVKKQSLWKMSETELIEMRDMVQENKWHPLSVAEEERDVALFVDASSYGWGAVLVLKDGRIKTAKGEWLWEAHIAVLEMLAISQAVCAFDLNNVLCHIFTDSENVRCVLEKGRSRSFPLHQAYKKVLKEKRARSLGFLVSRVVSKQNPADPLSRGKKFRNEHKKQAIQLAEDLGGKEEGKKPHL